MILLYMFFFWHFVGTCSFVCPEDVVELLFSQCCSGILIDHETPDPKPPIQPIIDAYDSIIDEASDFVAKNIDTVTPYQESYPPPVRVINGKGFVQNLRRYCGLDFSLKAAFYQVQSALGQGTSDIMPRDVTSIDQLEWHVTCDSGMWHTRLCLFACCDYLAVGKKRVI